MHHPRRAALFLAAWTLFVWTTRIRNVLTDDELGTAAKIGGVLLSLSFTVLGVAVVWAALRARDRHGRAVRALAGWTVGVWAVRSVGIAGGGHAAAFVAVHLALAAVSVALAWQAVRAVRGFPAVAGKH